MSENYLVNGVKLDNPAVGWRLLAATLPVASITKRKTIANRPGRDGHTLHGSTRAGTVPQFEVFVPAADWETLLGVFDAPELVITREGVSDRALYGDLKSTSTPKYYPR